VKRRQIDVLGDRVALLSGSEIDASGDIGGGTVHLVVITRATVICNCKATVIQGVQY